MSATIWKSPADGDLHTILATHTGGHIKVYLGDAGAIIIQGPYEVWDTSIIIGGNQDTHAALPVHAITEAIIWTTEAVAA